MNCKIKWNDLSLDEWEKRFSVIPRSNLLQSYVYARAVCKTKYKKARWGLILIGDQEAGLVQILETGVLGNLFHTIELDRGPLWFEGYGGAAHIKMFFEEFDKEFPKRFGRRRRFIPEVEGGMAAEKILGQSGLKSAASGSAYQTLWWDLSVDDDTARQNLKSNWRGSLNKAERAGLDIEWDDQGRFYRWIRGIYALDKQIRGYGGVSPKLLDNLAVFSAQGRSMIIGKASKDGRDIAATLFFVHGQSATYQLGWSSDEGRQHCAHHLLLWQARDILKKHGITSLDLGGVNDESAAGVKKFKEGTNAENSKLVGHYT